jgi:hypothetical protein
MMAEVTGPAMDVPPGSARPQRAKMSLRRIDTICWFMMPPQNLGVCYMIYVVLEFAASPSWPFFPHENGLVGREVSRVAVIVY